MKNDAATIPVSRFRLGCGACVRFQNTRADVQLQLIRLAEAEIDDALEVITSPRTAQPFLPVAVDRLGLAKAAIALALAPGATWQTRQSRVSEAISRVLNARDHLGANINFQLGKGNLLGGLLGGGHGGCGCY